MYKVFVSHPKSADFLYTKKAGCDTILENRK